MTTKASMAFGQMGQKQSCSYVKSLWNLSQKEKFKDTKGVVRSCKSKDRQQPKEKEQKDKQRSYKTLHRKLDRAT